MENYFVCDEEEEEEDTEMVEMVEVVEIRKHCTATVLMRTRPGCLNLTPPTPS